MSTKQKTKKQKRSSRGDRLRHHEETARAHSRLGSDSARRAMVLTSKLWVSHLLSAIHVSWAHSTPVTTSMSHMLAWNAWRGGGASIAVGTDHNGLRGLVAGCDSKPGDVLLEVPLSCCLSDAAADPATVGSPSVQPPPCTTGLDWQVQIACSLLVQRAMMATADDTSPDVLGSGLDGWADTPNLPFLLSDDHLALAGDDDFEHEVRGQREWAAEQLELARAAAEAQEDSVLMDCLRSARPFDEALASVWSRALRIRAPRPIGTRFVLAPLVDLANHDERPSALWEVSATKSGVIRLHATRSLSAGEPVTIAYGNQYDNAHFVRQYGFVPNANNADAVAVPLLRVLQSAHEEEDELSAPSPRMARPTWTAERLMSMGVDPNTPSPPKMHALAPSMELLGSLRLLLSGRSISTSGPCVPGDWDNGKAGGFADGDDAQAAAALRCVARAADSEASRIRCLSGAARTAGGASAADSATDTGVGNLYALHESKLALLTSLAEASDRMALSFSRAHDSASGKSASMSARMALQMAVMAAEPQPKPFSPRELEMYARREWDWVAMAYTP